MAPIWFQWTMSDVIGHRETEKALMLGHMYSTDEALSVGMIDKIVAQDELMNSAKTERGNRLHVVVSRGPFSKQSKSLATFDIKTTAVAIDTIYTVTGYYRR